MKNTIITYCCFIALTGVILGLWYFKLMDVVTASICILIAGAFCRYFYFLIQIYTFVPNKKKCTNIDELNKTFAHLTNLQNHYRDTISEDLKKTCVRAEEIYSTANIARALNINLKTVRSAPGVLSGLGVLGTFLGLTFGISNFDNNDTNAVLKSIDNLMNGMNTAFYTSIAGMLLSLVYMICEKKVLNDLYHATALWCKQLDKENYLSEIDILRRENHNQQGIILKTLNDIHVSNKERSLAFHNEILLVKEKLEELCTSSKEHTLMYKECFKELKQLQTESSEVLKGIFIGYDEDGEEVLPGPMLVHLYELKFRI